MGCFVYVVGTRQIETYNRYFFFKEKHDIKMQRGAKKQWMDQEYNRILAQNSI